MCIRDRFKNINDTWGRGAGDEVLEMLVSGVKAEIRASDFIGRYGGDEFLLVLDECEGTAAMSLLDRLRQREERERNQRRQTERGAGQPDGQGDLGPAVAENQGVEEEQEGGAHHTGERELADSGGGDRRPDDSEIARCRPRATFAGRAADVICLPHPSGASTWHRTQPGVGLLAKALKRVARHPAIAEAFA